MANPQIEDGHLILANELVDALAGIRISGEAMQILWVIIRQTYGWRKKEDAIPLSQFYDRTGITKPHIIKNIKKLVAMGIIAQKGNGTKKVYNINKNYEEWKPLPKKVTLPKKVIIVAQKGNDVAQKGNESLPKKVPSKDTTKDTTQNTRKTYVGGEDTAAYVLASHLFTETLAYNPDSRLHALKNGGREEKIRRWAYDIDLLIRVDHQDPSTVEEVITYVAHDDFWGLNVQSGAKLRQKWDRLVGEMKRRPNKSAQGTVVSKFARGPEDWIRMREEARLKGGQ